jgi:hypothetical protein
MLLRIGLAARPTAALTKVMAETMKRVETNCIQHVFEAAASSSCLLGLSGALKRQDWPRCALGEGEFCLEI